MAGELKLDTERSLSWTVPNTYLGFSLHTFKSPVFWFQNQDSECFFMVWPLEEDPDANAIVKKYPFRIYLSREGDQPCKIISFEKNTKTAFKEDIVTGSAFIGGIYNTSAAELWNAWDKTFGFVFDRGILRLEKERDFTSTSTQVDLPDFTSTSTQVDLPGGSEDCLTESPVEDSEKSPSGLQTLAEDFAKLLNEGSHHDVELKCGDDIFKAHRNILSTRSKVFAAMLASDMVEGQTGQVMIPDMDAGVFKQFLHYVYTGQMPKLTSDIALSLYETGDKFAVSGQMMKKCSDFLSENLTLENAYKMLILADAHSDDRFKNNVIAFIIDQNMHLQGDPWQHFSECHLKLAFEVLNQSAFGDFRMLKKYYTLIYIPWGSLLYLFPVFRIPAAIPRYLLCQQVPVSDQWVLEKGGRDKLIFINSLSRFIFWA